MNTIDEIRQKTDIVDIVSQYVKLTKTGKNMRGLCPFHSEKTGSFFVTPEQQSWHCFGCNSGGDIFAFIMKKEGIDFKEAMRRLADRAGIIIPVYQPREPKGEKDRLSMAIEAAAAYFHEILLNSLAAENIRSYLKERGFNARSIHDFRLGYSLPGWDSLKQNLLERGYTEKELLAAGLVSEAPEGNRIYDRFRGRLMFPIADVKGHIIGFGARSMDGSDPKYLNSPQSALFDKSGGFYGINFAASEIREKDQAVIVEGYVDVIIAHQYGYHNVVASMGTAITETQVLSIRKSTRNIVLALDPDAAGEEAMLRGLTLEKSVDAEVKVVVLPDGEDPDEVIKKDVKIWEKYISEAVPMMDYTFKMATAGLDLNTARDKTAARAKLFPLIHTMSDDIRRLHYLEKLAKLLKMPYNEILGIYKIEYPAQRARKTGAPVKKQITKPPVSSPVEEYCLALLLQHDELKQNREIIPEYFTGSENREIFLAWRETADFDSLKQRLDAALYDYIETLKNRSLPADQFKERYADCVSRVKEKYLKDCKARESQMLAMAAEGGDATLTGQDTGTCSQLLEIWKARKGETKEK